MFCAKCGVSLPETASFCRACGSAVRHPVSDLAPAAPSAPDAGRVAPLWDQMSMESTGLPTTGAERRETRGGISLGLGLAGLLFGFFPLSIGAIVLANQARASTRPGEAQHALATAGRVLGWIVIALSVVCVMGALCISAFLLVLGSGY